MVATVFIDGDAGTTGLEIRERLAGRRDLRIEAIDPLLRKDVRVRRERLNSADAVILCLPDAAAREAVALIVNQAVRVIDASTAHRVAAGWTYGFPEMASGQRAAIVGAARIANPGCYPTGFIALVRPLVAAGLVPPDWPLTVNAVSGYSGGGRAMIAAFEDEASPDFTKTAFRPYALALDHKHVPEMRVHAGLIHPPLFTPAVGRYRQGMIVEVPLALHALPSRPGAAEIHAALARAYDGEAFVRVAPRAESAALVELDPEALNGADRMDLHVFGGEGAGGVRLVAILDNLGKGAAGAAVQNLNLVLGLPESAGLITKP